MLLSINERQNTTDRYQGRGVYNAVLDTARWLRAIDVTHATMANYFDRMVTHHVCSVGNVTLTLWITYQVVGTILTV